MGFSPPEGFHTQKTFARARWLLLYGLTSSKSPTRLVFLRERRKVSVVELIQVDVAGVKVDESPTIKSGDLNVAKLAPRRRKVPLLDESTANAARIVDVTVSCRAIGIGDIEVATLLVGTNRHQFQFAPEEVDITQADVKYVPVEVTRTSINIGG